MKIEAEDSEFSLYFAVIWPILVNNLGKHPFIVSGIRTALICSLRTTRVAKHEMQPTAQKTGARKTVAYPDQYLGLYSASGNILFQVVF